MASVSRWVTSYIATSLHRIRGNIQEDAQKVIECEAQKSQIEAQLKTYEQLRSRLIAVDNLTIAEISSNMGYHLNDSCLDIISDVKKKYPSKDVRRIEASFNQTLALYRRHIQTLKEREETIRQVYSHLASCKFSDLHILSLLPNAIEHAKPLLSNLKKQSRSTPEQIEGYKKLHSDVIEALTKTMQKWRWNLKDKKTNKKEPLMPVARRILDLNGALRVLADISLSLKERINLAAKALADTEKVKQEPFGHPIQSKPMWSTQRQPAPGVPRHRSLPLG